MGDNSSMDKQLNRFYHLEVSRMSGLRVRIMESIVQVQSGKGDKAHDGPLLWSSHKLLVISTYIPWGHPWL